MDEAVAAVRAFTRFYTRFVGALDAHYLDSDLSLAEARLLYEIANREAPLAAELQAELGLDAGYVSRMLRRFQAEGWILRGRGADARRRPISLTAEGRRAFDALDARTRAQVGERIEALGDGDRSTLVEALGAARALLGGGTVPWHIRTFRAGDLATIAARQSILYEPYGWGRPMEVLQGEVTTAFLRDFKPGREQCWVAERALGARPRHRQRAGRRVRRLRACGRLRHRPPVDPHGPRLRPPHLRSRRLPHRRDRGPSRIRQGRAGRNLGACDALYPCSATLSRTRAWFPCCRVFRVAGRFHPAGNHSGIRASRTRRNDLVPPREFTA
jgi:DNA-binding MarR family transcriptional regulator